MRCESEISHEREEKNETMKAEKAIGGAAKKKAGK
jgi:hypothetical protein